MAVAGRTRATIGIDVGTSGLKGVLLAEDGRVLDTATATYPCDHPRPGWSEQDPARWWQACCAVLNELKRSADAEIVGLGLTGQMHGAVFLDSKHEVVRPAILWNDARTRAEIHEIEERIPRARLIEITGNRASAGFQAPKILWLAANEPEHAHRVASILLPKDYLRLELTGELATDASDASGTLLLDFGTRRWSREVIETLGIDERLLPEVFESTEITGRISVEAAAATGLKTGLPVVAGGGDNACAALGMGLIDDGGGCSLGTSGTIFVRSPEPMLDRTGSLNAFCDAAGGWHLMGVILSAGASLGWWAERILDDPDGIEALLEGAAAVPAGAEGLMFLPYLAGERSPHMNPDARGAWLGLTLAHDRRHLTRALLEGVGFALRDCLERMRELGLRPERLALTGGGSKSAFWRGLLASQLDVELEGAANGDGPALGAAMLATVGTGIFPDLAAAVTACVRPPTFRVQADPKHARIYAGVHGRWRAAYPALQAAGLF